MNLRSIAFVPLFLGLSAAASHAVPVSLLGTELILNGVQQARPDTKPATFAAGISAIVSATEIEYPNVNDFDLTDTTVEGFPFPVTLVGTSIDAGADFISIGFENSAPFSQFAPAFQNTYVFTFADSVVPTITSATIDRDVTTLGLDDSDVSFIGNQLSVNVESLFFNTSTFARISLTAVDTPEPKPPVAPVPLPGGLSLILAAIVGVGVVGSGRKTRNARLSSRP